MLVIGLVAAPAKAHASWISDLFGAGTAQADTAADNAQNSQNASILQAMPAIDPTAKLDSNVEIVDGSALVAQSGPLGTAADVVADSATSDQISVYVVHKGDTIAAIAKMFDVSSNTILWANNLSKGQALTEGQTLVILPVTGVQYTIKKGDTLASIAKKLGADAGDIGAFNGIAANTTLVVGDTIIIPDGVGAETAVASTNTVKKGGSTYTKGAFERLLPGYGGPAHDGYYMRPVSGRVTQPLHLKNAADFAGSIGSPIVAAASGKVVYENVGGWGLGYGTYMIINHPNGTQTLYAHMSRVAVGQGDLVKQGQVIGYVGSTGNSTGPHLHFEVRGAKNPVVDGTWAK